MNASRHQRIKEIFSELCDQSPQRRRFRLDTLSVTDPNLAHDVEALLLHSDSPAFDLDDVDQLSSLVGEIAAGPESAFARPQRIGAYDIVDEIGQGGMGVVYLAQQNKPLKRQVAIKVVRPGMDSRQVLMRFDMERRTLAAMNHPCIAAVHDAGVTEEGRPYFVMQHVEGTRITTYCDENTLSINERLDLFLKVCDAVMHAHQKGVIHRDLKPSNILIEERSGAAAPKVIDFGVAKAMSPLIGEETVHTAPGQMLGTPQYMSPEQTQLDSMHVDTRSDVFSLGALLYELLCGSAPIDAETIRSASFDQVCKLIREAAAVPPSRRIAHMQPDEAQRVAACRSASPGELARSLRGELDWITRTAMEKEPQQRYESVSALAGDIERFRKHEPVMAGPISTMYRTRKFVRRNRGAVVAGSIVIALFLLLVSAIAAGAVTYALQAREIANQQQAIAEKERENANQANEVARQAQEAARQADNNQQIVEFMEGMLSSADPVNARGKDTTLREFTDHAAARLWVDQSLPGEVAASLHNTVGATYAGLGDYDNAERHFEESRDISLRLHGITDRRTLRSVGNLVYTLHAQHRFGEAYQLGAEHLPIAEDALGPYATETRLLTTNLAMAAEKAGDVAEAERLYRLNVERCGAMRDESPGYYQGAIVNLGVFFMEKGDFDGGEPLLRESLAIARDLHGENHPDTLIAMANIAALQQRRGNIEASHEMCAHIVEVSRQLLGPTHPMTLQRLRNLAIVTVILSEYSEAEQLLAPAFEQAAIALGHSHPDVIGIAEVFVTAISYQDRIEEAVNLALAEYALVCAEVDADHARAKRSAKLVAEAYDTWEKPDLYREWLVRAGEMPAE
jgi:serine/threonine protein kinase/tetratricopeptide (TPR) repeat protein